MSDENVKELKPKTRGLGRGLNALFEDEEGVYPQAGTKNAAPEGRAKNTLGIEQMVPGQYQPRQNFDEETLGQLADSIKAHGLLQPILVRPISSDKGETKYEIIAGERRWRAAQKAQLHEVPVIIQDFTDAEALEVALVENLQREDLNPIDEAAGYQRLIQEFGHTQDQLAEAVHKSRSHVANTVRLLNLPVSIQKYVIAGKLSSGHARALITAKDPEALAKIVIAKGLTVRQTEKLAAEESGRTPKTPGKATKSFKAGAHKSADTLALEKELSDKLGMSVALFADSDTTGTLHIKFRDLDQLDEIIRRLSTASASRLMG